MVNITTIVVGKWNVNCYIIESNGSACVIDPGDDFEVIDKRIVDLEINIDAVINTHGHFDHIGAVEQMRRKYKVPFYIHSREIRSVKQSNLYRRLAGDNAVCLTPTIDEHLDDKRSISFNGIIIKTHCLPGHSKGSVCFEIENRLFTGDLIFKNGFGRTDLPGGNNKDLQFSINYILDNFFGFHIYPGHGESFIMDEKYVFMFKELLENEFNN